MKGTKQFKVTLGKLSGLQFGQLLNQAHLLCFDFSTQFSPVIYIKYSSCQHSVTLPSYFSGQVTYKVKTNRPGIVSLRNNENVRLYTLTQKIHPVQHCDSYHRSVISCCREKKWEMWHSNNHWELSWLVMLGQRQISASVIKCQQHDLSCPEVQSPPSFPTRVCWRAAAAGLGKGGHICGKSDAVCISVDPGRSWCKREYGMIARSLTRVSTIVHQAKLSSFLCGQRF